MPGRLLPRQFYARDALDVARDLLGYELWHWGVGLRITEVEAYRYPDDSANHCRAGKEGPVLLTGPGKVGQALGLDASYSGHALYRRGGLEAREGVRASEIIVGSCIGIGYAKPEHLHAEWRLAVAGTPWVSHARHLRGAER